MNQLNIYSSPNSARSAASNLIIYGASIAKRSKILSEIDQLDYLLRTHGSKNISENDVKNIVMPYVFEALIDSIRIGVFFENYIKAKLLLNHCIVHNIDQSILVDVKLLLKDQKKRPLTIDEVHKTSNFEFDEVNKVITNKILKPTTLSYSLILNKPAYRKIHEMEEVLVTILNEFNQYRNRLHLHHELSYVLSSKMIKDVKVINEFIDDAINLAVK